MSNAFDTIGRELLNIIKERYEKDRIRMCGLLLSHRKMKLQFNQHTNET